MDKEKVKKILEKIKETVGENNYKLALAITGHRPGKIRDVTMASKDGELLLEYVEQLEQQVKKQKEVIDKISEFCKNDKNFEILDLYSQDSVDEIQTNLLDILKEVSE